MFENPRKLPHILTFTETWFHEGSGRNLPDYRAYHTFRHSARSGGVSVYVNDKIPSQLVEEMPFSNNCIEVCTVEIQLNSKKYFIVAIYRPHSGTISSFVSALSQLLDNHNIKSNINLLMGDFNINLLSHDPPILQFVKKLQSFNFP